MIRTGRPVTHCVGCGRQVLDADFQRGKAFRFTGGLLCVACAVRRPDCVSLEQRDFLRKLTLPSPPPRTLGSDPDPASLTKTGRIPYRTPARSSASHGLPLAGIVAGLLAVALLGTAAKGRNRAPRAAPELPRPVLASIPEPEPPPDEIRPTIEGRPLPPVPAPPPPPVSSAPPAVAPPADRWRPLCDGTSVEFLRSSCRNAWHAERGGIEPAPGDRHAAQTLQDFADGELRVRFDVLGVASVYFAIRQGGEGRYAVSLVGDALRTGTHEFVFTCREEQVSASLDGQSVAVETEGRPRSGCLQFNASGGSFRILSIDVR